ncbi:replication endonuclease [Neptuniibacter caesariensis]|nr:replication endonuclease [Neptuniibacter caesariensis]
MKFYEPFLCIKVPTGLTHSGYLNFLENLPRKWKRLVTKESLHSAHLLELIGSREEQSEIIDENTARLVQERDEANEEYLKQRALLINNREIPITCGAERLRNKFNETYSVIKGLEAKAVDEGKSYIFVTMTASPEFHPSPKTGDSSWNLSKVSSAHQDILKRWQNVKKRLAKRNISFSGSDNSFHIFGIRVVEPHLDGCPHHHALLFLDSEIISTVQEVFTDVFDFSNKAVDIKVQDESLEDSATAASYCTKYLLKTYNLTNDYLEDDENHKIKVSDENSNKVKVSKSDAVLLWRKALGIRAYALIGIKAKIAKYRSLRYLKDLTKKGNNQVSSKLSKAIKSILNPKKKDGQFYRYMNLESTIDYREDIRSNGSKVKYILDTINCGKQTSNVCWLPDVCWLCSGLYQMIPASKKEKSDVDTT